MVKAQHLFENGVYLISNHTVAKNSMFDDENVQAFFHQRMEKHLSPVCNILAYCLSGDEFQLLVKLRSKEEISKHFLSKARNRALMLTESPEETYVFSQAMANLQVSFVKYYNFVNKRSGTLMAGRFTRILIESGDELNEWINRLNDGVKRHNYSARWASEKVTSCKSMTSKWLYDSDDQCDSKTSSVFTKANNLNLVGYFSNLPPLRLESSISYYKLRFNQLFGPNPGNFF